MAKPIFWFTVLVMCDTFVFFQAYIIPVLHSGGRYREGNCSLSENATDDYYKVRDFIFTFLENAETDFGTMSDQEKISSCQSAKEVLSELIKKGKVDWANCLTDEFAYFGDFVHDTLQNFLDFFCAKGSDHIEGYFAEEAKLCRTNIKKPLFDQCLVKLLSKKNKGLRYDLSFNSFLIPGKRDELCRKLLDIGPCTAEVLETHCPHLNYYQQLSGKLFAQTVKPCDEYVTYLSTARIVGISLTSISIVIALVVRFCPLRRWYADFKHRSESKSLINSAI